MACFPINFFKKLFQKKKQNVYLVNDDQDYDENFKIFEQQLEKEITKIHSCYQQLKLDDNKIDDLNHILSNSKKSFTEIQFLSTFIDELQKNLKELKDNISGSLNKQTIATHIKEFIEMQQKIILYVSNGCRAQNYVFNKNNFENFAQDLKLQNSKLKFMINQLRQSFKEISLKNNNDKLTKVMNDLFENIEFKQNETNENIKLNQEEIYLGFVNKDENEKELCQNQNLIQKDQQINDGDKQLNNQNKQQKDKIINENSQQNKNLISLSNENQKTILSIISKIKSLNLQSNPNQHQLNQDDIKIISIEDNFRNVIQSYQNILQMLSNLNCINIQIIKETNRMLSPQNTNAQLIQQKLYQVMLDSEESKFSDKCELQKRILEKNNKKLYTQCMQNQDLFNRILEEVSLKDIIFLITLDEKQRNIQIQENKVKNIIQKDYESDKIKQLLQLNKIEMDKIKNEKQQIEGLKFLEKQEKQLKKQLLQTEKSFKKAQHKNIILVNEVIQILVEQIQIGINKVNFINIKNNFSSQNYFLNKLV
ncbi:hypothetical protein ABPG74_013051, partial [Tetrahymena malaccensis]